MHRVRGRECKFAELGATFHRRTVFAPMQSIYGKEATQKCKPCGEPKNVNLILVQKAHFAVRAYKLPDFMHRVWWRKCKFAKLGATFHRGTVFAPMQSIYGKEATEVENPKM